MTRLFGGPRRSSLLPREVAALGSHNQISVAGCMGHNFDRTKLTFSRWIAGFVDDRVLIADIVRHLLADGIDFVKVLRKESHAPGLEREGFKGTLGPMLLAFTAQNSNGVDHRTILILHSTYRLLQRVTTLIVLTVCHHKQNFLLALGRLCQMIRRSDHSIVERSAASRVQTIQSFMHLVQVVGEIQVQIWLIVEIDDENLIARIAGLDEIQYRCRYFLPLLPHGAGIVYDNANRDRNVFAPNIDNLLRFTFFVNLKIAPREVCNQPTPIVNHGNGQHDVLHPFDHLVAAFAFYDLARWSLTGWHNIRVARCRGIGVFARR